VQTQVALAKLTDMLVKKQYVQIRDAVRDGAAGTKRPQTEYTPAALFLILESMGGTWCMYEKLVMDKRIIRNYPNYKKDLDLILRQTLYDLTMWDSIRNTPKHTRYMSHNVQKFIDAYGLKNDEPQDGADDSSDDDAPPSDPASAAPAAAQGVTSKLYQNGQALPTPRRNADVSPVAPSAPAPTTSFSGRSPKSVPFTTLPPQSPAPGSGNAAAGP
jgi:hypothetical protein